MITCVRVLWLGYVSGRRMPVITFHYSRHSSPTIIKISIDFSGLHSHHVFPNTIVMTGPGRREPRDGKGGKYYLPLILL